MSALSAVQVAALALQQGLTSAQAAVATAIAEAESGFQPTVQGDIGLQDGTWGPSVGLWQVRSVKKQSGTGGARDASKLSDPLFNAASMKSISAGGTNWQPWSTYTNGAYRQYLAIANSAVAMAQSQGSRTVVSQIGDNYGALAGAPSSSTPTATDASLGSVADGVAGALKNATDPLGAIKALFTPEIPIRVLEVTVGIGLMTMGLSTVIFMLARAATPEPVKKAAFLAGDVALGAAAPELGAAAYGAKRAANAKRASTSYKNARQQTRNANVYDEHVMRQRLKGSGRR